jgi:sugar phosphate isomerase/epimerase
MERRAAGGLLFNSPSELATPESLGKARPHSLSSSRQQHAFDGTPSFSRLVDIQHLMNFKSCALIASLLIMPGASVASAESVAGDPESGNPFYAMDTGFQRAGLSPDQQLELVRELGFAGIAWHEQSPREAQAAALQAEQHGLKMFAIYCAAQVSPDGGLTFSPELPALMNALRGHGTIIWLHLGGKGPAFDTLTGSEPLIGQLRMLSGLAVTNDLRVALYPHVGEWTARFSDATKVAKLVGHARFGVTFNLCHALAMGDERKIPELLEAAGTLLTTVTINGADSGVDGLNWARLIQPLNKGSYDLGIVLRTLKEIRFQGPIGFQGYGITGDARSILEPTMTEWRRLTK